MIEPVTTPEAIAAVEKLARTIWEEHYTPIIGAAQVAYMIEKYQSAAAIEKQIRDEAYRYYLLDGVGYFSIQCRGERLFLSKLYLLKSHRGAGLGRKAVDFICKEALRMGLGSVELTVNKHNSGAIAAYECMGFERCEAVVAEIGDGFVMDDYVMRKRLR